VKLVTSSVASDWTSLLILRLRLITSDAVRSNVIVQLCNYCGSVNRHQQVGASIITIYQSELLECSKWYSHCMKKGKGSPYWITERRVPELIPVFSSQPAGNVSHKPGGKLPLLSARPAVTPQPLRGLLPILLLGEQRRNGCEQFA